MKFIRKIAHSRMCLPVCGALSLMALVYIAFAVREFVTDDTPLSQRMLVLQDLPVENEPYIPSEQHTIDQADQEGFETFTAREEIDLPMGAPGAEPEIFPSEHETALPPEQDLPEQNSPEQDLPGQNVTEQGTKPPAATQKPTGSVTTKPPAATTKPPATTQKPAQTTKPQSTPITAWNVTYKQAKSMVKSDAAYDYEDLYWLSRIISAEAKGESFTGQIGVGTVVLNRVKSKQFPNTVKGVVFDKKYGTQFTPVANGSIYDTPSASAVVAAKMCLDGYTLSGSVLYFLNPRIATSSWIQQNRKYAFRVGNHDFYY